MNNKWREITQIIYMNLNQSHSMRYHPTRLPYDINKKWGIGSTGTERARTIVNDIEKIISQLDKQDNDRSCHCDWSRTGHNPLECKRLELELELEKERDLST